MAITIENIERLGRLFRIRHTKEVKVEQYTFQETISMSERFNQSTENTHHLDVPRARARSYYRIYLEKKFGKTNRFTAPAQT
jgi:hypothetical protein